MYLLSDSGIEYLLAYTFYTFFIFPCEERERWADLCGLTVCFDTGQSRAVTSLELRASRLGRQHGLLCSLLGKAVSRRAQRHLAAARQEGKLRIVLCVMVI